MFVALGTAVRRWAVEGVTRVLAPPTVAIVGTLASPVRGWQRLPAIPASLRSLHPHGVVVLAGDAITSLDIKATLLAAPAGSVVLCADGAHPARLAEWILSGALLVTSGPDLGEFVRVHFAHLRLRVPLLLAEWNRREVETGSAAWTALSAIPRLERPFRVRAWHAALGYSRGKLADVSRSDLGATPSEVLWWYVEAQARRLRGEGHQLGSIAHRLGYCDAAALVHAWKRRGLAPLVRADGRAPPR